MKKLIGTLILIFVMASVYSQGRRGGSSGILDRIKVEKISFLATQLDLSPSEAQEFWPVYNEFERKRFKLEMTKQKLELKLNGSLDTVPEYKLKELNNEFISAFSTEAQLMEEYNDRFNKILPIWKVVKLYQAERKFRSHMLQEFRRRELDVPK